MRTINKEIQKASLMETFFEISCFFTILFFIASFDTMTLKAGTILVTIMLAAGINSRILANRVKELKKDRTAYKKHRESGKIVQMPFNTAA